jgi:hypothetical protein
MRAEVGNYNFIGYLEHTHEFDQEGLSELVIISILLRAFVLFGLKGFWDMTVAAGAVLLASLASNRRRSGHSSDSSDITNSSGRRSERPVAQFPVLTC